jgi:DNA-binding MarR family transcriptional regulator
MTLDEKAIVDLERAFAVFVRQDRAASGRLGRDVNRELTDATYRLLAHLAEQGPCRATELACHAGVSPPTVSKQLHDMQVLGLVDRLQAAEDGRAYLVRLTDEGRRQVAEVQAARTRRLGELLASWTAQDVSTFTSLLVRFNGTAAQPSRRCGGRE